MKQIINVCVSEDLHISSDKSRIGFEQENNAAVLGITLPEAQRENRVFLDIQLPDAERFRTPCLIANAQGTAWYPIPGAITAKKGILQLQLIFEDESGFVRKSEIFPLELGGSINAENDIYDSVMGFTASAQMVLDEMRTIITAYENGELDGQSAYAAAVSAGFTGTEEQFALILSSAQENIIESIKINGEEIIPVFKTVDITIPQNTVSGTGISAISVLTQEDYAAIESPSPDTLYIIVEEE